MFSSVRRSEQKKSTQLGMHIQTAVQRLQRLILFDLAKRLNLDKCFHCEKQITTVNELTIEHKKAWLDVDPALYWDLTNIAFSHHRCNSRAGRKTIASQRAGGCAGKGRTLSPEHKQKLSVSRKARLNYSSSG